MTPQQEALRRIADAKASNAELLDLGDLWLKEVPKELGELTQLRVLSLGKYQPHFEETGKLSWKFDNFRSSQSFRDVQPVQNLTGLTSLNLSGCKQLTDVEALRGLTGLTSLELGRCEQLSDVEALRGL